MIRTVPRQPRLRIDSREAHQPHQPADPLAIHPIALVPKPSFHPPRSIERVFRELLIDPSHEGQIKLVLSRGFVVEGRT